MLGRSLFSFFVEGRGPKTLFVTYSCYFGVSPFLLATIKLLVQNMFPEQNLGNFEKYAPRIHDAGAGTLCALVFLGHLK